MQKRIFGERPDFTLETEMETSSNYYPINSAIVFKDSDSSLQMTVMNDRPQGGSVNEYGAIELMQNRRIIARDHRGLEESLDERDP